MIKRRPSVRRSDRANPAKCGDVLSGTLESLGLVRVIRHLALLKAWDRAIPSRVRERATLEAFKEGRLYLQAEDPIWLHELHMLRHQMKTMLNEELGAPVVEEIILRIGRTSRRSAAATRTARDQKTSVSPGGSVARIEELLTPVDESPCRDAVERLLHRWTARLI